MNILNTYTEYDESMPEFMISCGIASISDTMVHAHFLTFRAIDGRIKLECWGLPK